MYAGGPRGFVAEGCLGHLGAGKELFQERKKLTFCRTRIQEVPFPCLGHGV